MISTVNRIYTTDIREECSQAKMNYLKAERIWVHHLFQDCSWIFLLFFLVRLRNCFNDPDDMYSVIKINLGNLTGPLSPEGPAAEADEPLAAVAAPDVAAAVGEAEGLSLPGSIQ